MSEWIGCWNLKRQEAFGWRLFYSRWSNTSTAHEKQGYFLAIGKWLSSIFSQKIDKGDQKAVFVEVPALSGKFWCIPCWPRNISLVDADVFRNGMYQSVAEKSDLERTPKPDSAVVLAIKVASADNQRQRLLVVCEEVFQQVRLKDELGTQ